MNGRDQLSGNQSGAANPPKQKVCEKCGVKFDCYSLGGPCWCEEVTLIPQSLANLRAQFNDCLCPTCLKAAAGQQSA
jgi:hypothetical protein